MALSFFPAPTGKEAELLNLTQSIASKVLRPQAIEDDQKAIFRKDAFVALAKKGLASVVTPAAYGGLGESYQHHYAVIEEIARASTAMAITVAVNNLPQGALLAFGTEEQKKQFLTPLTNGEGLGAFSLSEPGSGSDAAGLTCAAKKVDGGYRITGTKSWCSSAGSADVYLLIARTAEHKTKGISAFLITPEMKGFRVGKQEDKLGLRASPLGELVFEDCFVADSHRLGEEGDGLRVALSQLDAGRVVIGVVGYAIALEALERGLQHAAQHPEGDTWRFHWAEFYARAQSVKSLIRQAAERFQAKESITTLAAQVKLLGSDLAMETTSAIVADTGAWGVRCANEMERLFRDAKALQIVEGTNQIQRLVLSRQVEKDLQ